MSQNQPQRVEVTLFEEQEGAPTMAAEHAGWWNGFAVPRVTAQTVIDYWAACRAHDPNGEWYAVPFVDDAGHLRIPSANDPEDREEDYVYAPNDDETFDLDGLVWSVVTPAYVVNLPGPPDEFGSAREAWVWLADRHVEWCDDLEAIGEQVTRDVFDVDSMPDRPGFVRVEHPTEPGRVVLYSVSKR